PSTSRRMSSGGSSSSFSRRSTVQSIPMPASTSMTKSRAVSARPSSSNGGSSALGSIRSFTGATTGAGARFVSSTLPLSTDTCFSLSKRGRRLAAVAFSLLAHLDRPGRVGLRLQVTFHEELLPDPEPGVREHVHAEAGGEEQHHEREHGRHHVQHHL